MYKALEQIRQPPQKLKYISASAFINLIKKTVALVFFMSCATPHAQANPEDYSYLNHGIVLSRHAIQEAQDSSPYSFDIDNLSDFETYTLEDAAPYYFEFDAASCHVDPFIDTDKNSDEPSYESRKAMVTCLRNRLWDNDNIPFWIRATGATVLIGAAGSAGKVDDDLKLKIGFDKINAFLRDRLPIKN